MGVRLIQVKYWILYPIFGVAFTLLGCLFWRMRAECVPLLLAVLLGPMMEEHFRRSLRLSNGDLAVFYQRRLSVEMLSIAAAMSVVVLLPQIRRRRSTV